jgi:hypothetical protein
MSNYLKGLLKWLLDSFNLVGLSGVSVVLLADPFVGGEAPK